MNNNLHIGWVGLLVAALLSSCSPRTLREAQAVVLQADSLWSAGQMCSDSVSLAQAYETLDQWHWISPDAYVHACYHYGKLLREKEDPVSAMQAFINATHTRSHDYQILARVYSNMGDICHYANDFSLSYDMFEKSANTFLYANDTMSYYYSLYSMAFELAELKDSCACLQILQEIEHIPELSIWIALTKAELYKNIVQYDSAICYVNSLQSLGIAWPVCTIIKAQSFSELGVKDSAILYATRVLEDTLSPYQHRFNALYILSHNDSALKSNEIRDISSEREDIRYYEYEPLQEKLSQAVQLLEQDLSRTPNLTWLYSILATLVLIGICAKIYVTRKRKKHQLLSQQIQELEERNEDTREQIRKQIEERCELLAKSTNLKEELGWNNYEKMSAVVNLRFYGLVDRLHSYALSEKETRLCVLVLLQASTNQMVDMIPYARTGIGKFKYTTARKLGTNTANMRAFLISLIE